MPPVDLPKNSAEQLHQSEQTFHVLVESIQDYAIYTLDPNGIVVSWNTGAQRIKGYSASEILGQHFRRFYTSADLKVNKPNHNLEMALREGRYEDESLRVRKDGSIFLANVVITPIRDSSGTLTGYAKVVRDITERKASEQRVYDSERLAALGTTAAVFAHEVANPLNGLSSSFQLIRDILNVSGYHDPLVDETIEKAGQEIQRLAGLLKDYRSLARPNTLKIEPANLQRIVDEVLAPNRKNYINAGIRVVTDFDEDLPLVPLDSAKIKQVILNLCKNAVEAMSSGGVLTVKSYRRGDSIVLEVSDTGPGIPEGFDPFQLFKSNKPQGTGLGLPIVQQIMSDHHGTVDYNSQVGQGTTFRLSLPLQSPHSS
jgi:PAS domain S-box-containing protein